MGGGGSKPKKPKCPECDCSKAADRVAKKIQVSLLDGKKWAIDKTMNSAIDKLVDPKYQQSLNNSLGQDELDTFKAKWVTIQPRTKIITEGTEGTEGFENNETIKFLEDAIKIRDDYFRKKYDDISFKIECNANAANAISSLLIKDKEDLDKLYNYYNAYLDDYKNLTVYKDSTISIITNKLNELESITNKINNYNKSMIIDNRKSNYQKNNYDFYKNLHFYILILYYALFVLYLIFSKFIKEKKYNDKKIIFIMLIYLILPFILKYLLNFINLSYNYILETNNLKQDTLSYEDMINNKTK